jgi:NAD-dependent DNA ligase
MSKKTLRKKGGSNSVDIKKRNTTLKLKQRKSSNTIEQNTNDDIPANIQENNNKDNIKDKYMSKRLNEDFASVMSELNTIMNKKGEPFRARAYAHAEETILNVEEDITDYSQLKGKPKIGDIILSKLKEYQETGTLRLLEKERNDPLQLFTNIHGVGPKKAQQLIAKNIKTIEQLKENKEELNDTQKIGLQYYEDLLQRIPRNEITEYETKFNEVIQSLNDNNISFEIVGSYRRGVANSGDIDVIITHSDDDDKVFKMFIDALHKEELISETLSNGKTKSMTIMRLPDKKPRRVDLLYSSPVEYPFAILYFTGSKAFNTVMRGHALKKGLTLNEHGFHKMVNKKKGDKVEDEFKTEKDIFDYLGLEYKEPIQRKDGRSVVKTTNAAQPLIEQKEKENEEKEEEINEPIDEPTEEVEKEEKEENEEKEEPTEEVEKEEKEEPTEEVEKVEKEEPTEEVEKVDKEEPSKIIKRLKSVNNVNKSLKNKVTSSSSEKKNLSIKNKVGDNKDIIHFQKMGISYLDKLTDKKLNKMMEYASDVYYNTKQTIMTDSEYDIVKEYVEHKFPKSKMAKAIGAPVRKDKVTLPYFMGSMDKIKPDTGAIDKWKTKYKGPYVISCKLDGVSGLYSTMNGEPKLYTRGDGKVGQDVSHLIKCLKLPSQSDVVIRGEFIIKKQLFEDKYSAKFSNPRNFVSGIVNSKAVDKEKCADIDFVAYEVIAPELKPSEQMSLLETLQVEVVQNLTVENVDNKHLSDMLVLWRNSYIYEMDGIICANDGVYKRKDGNPDHAFAFKMILLEQIVETKVLDVLWAPSKDGYLKPRIQVEPIRIGGVKIEYATAFNADFIQKNKLGVGAVVKIIRSGDVIPYIMDVVEPATIVKMPDEKYVWNDTHIDIMLENKSDNQIVINKVLTGFFTILGVKSVSTGNIQKIMNAGYTTIPVILKMTKDDFEKIDGFGKKLAEKVHSGIQEKVKEAPIVKIMSASNLFGHGMAGKKLEIIIDAYPDILVSSDSKNEKIDKIANVKGMARKTATAFVENIDEFLKFIHETELTYKLEVNEKEKPTYNEEHELFGKNIVMTGFRDEEFSQKMEKKYGAKMSSSVNSKTFVLLVKDIEETTGKAEQARKHNVPIMTMEMFMEKYNV